MDKATILIVDDEPANLAVLNQLLMPDYRVLACKSGEQALQTATRAPGPDLILLDVMMPGMDGYAVITRLREDEKTNDIPVIFVTALDDAVDEEHGLELGAVDYIAKPVKPAILKARVGTHLEIKWARDRLKNQNVWLEAEVARRMHENVLIQNISLCALAQLAETRDSDTGNHILRTQAYVEAIARKLQNHPRFAPELDEVQLMRIVKAAPLHDIGKVGIPDRILLKPGKLTEEEWAVMKDHCRIGAEAIGNAIERVTAEERDTLKEQCRIGGKAIGRVMEKPVSMMADPIFEKRPESLAFLEVARVIAMSHHEKWDGAGYPEGLAGTSIPLPGRLMALADVFDALTTARVYKQAWTMEDAVACILKEKGKHFDPDIVNAFYEIRDTFDEIRRCLADSEPEADFRV
jgi:putative two-component system response regulator